MTGIPTECTLCSQPLDAHNLTGLCRECKHILRDARAGFTTDEAMPSPNPVTDVTEDLEAK